VYVAGSCYSTWGSPLAAFAGARDGFVVKFNPSGERIWNTFLGSAYTDVGDAIAMDGSGRITVGGYSIATWGSPVNNASGSIDAFVAQLDRDGGLLWNTFLGTPVEDMGWGVALDQNGNVYTTGASTSTWGSPVVPFAGLADAFVAKISVPHLQFLPVVLR
jgi:hypothetical protein